MHHKYVVRDREAVWTGSANWTTDSWTRQENVVVARRLRGSSAPPTSRTSRSSGSVATSSAQGVATRDSIELGDGRSVRGVVHPGARRGSCRSGSRRRSARARRVRIASPVITSAPILGTLAEAGRARASTSPASSTSRRPTPSSGSGRTNGNSAWKIPLLAQALERAAVFGQAVDAVGPGSTVHDFMHAKVDGRRRHRLRRLLQPLALGRAERRERARDPRPEPRRAHGGVRRRGPRALPARRMPVAGDGDDLGGLVGELGDLEVGRRDPSRARAARRAPSRAAPTSSRCRRGRPGGRSPCRSGSGSAPRTVSSSVPKPPGKSDERRE